METKHKQQTEREQFIQQGTVKRPSFLSEYLYLLRTSKKYWMAPLILLLLGFGLIMVLASTGAAPFIYTLF
jgi:hypothetical protein